MYDPCRLHLHTWQKPDSENQRRWHKLLGTSINGHLLSLLQQLHRIPLLLSRKVISVSQCVKQRLSHGLNSIYYLPCYHKRRWFGPEIISRLLKYLSSLCIWSFSLKNLLKSHNTNSGVITKKNLQTVIIQTTEWRFVARCPLSFTVTKHQSVNQSQSCKYLIIVFNTIPSWKTYSEITEAAIWWSAKIWCHLGSVQCNGWAAHDSCSKRFS